VFLEPIIVLTNNWINQLFGLAVADCIGLVYEKGLLL